MESAVTVFPDPDSPTSAVISPRLTVKEIFFTAWVISCLAGLALLEFREGARRRAFSEIKSTERLSICNRGFIKTSAIVDRGQE